MSNKRVLSVKVSEGSQNSGASMPTPPPERQVEQSSFDHHSEYCVCGGSGVGCDCVRICHCSEAYVAKCHCGRGCYNSWDPCMLG